MRLKRNVGLAFLLVLTVPGLAQPPGLSHAQALLQQQNWTAAADEFRELAKVAPNNADVRIGLALALRSLGDSGKAEAELQTALRLQPNHEPARLALGLLLQQNGDLAGAIVQYKEAIRRNPKSAEAHNWLGVAYMQKNTLAEAAAELREAVKLQPDFVRAYNNLGSTLGQAGNWDEAIKAFESGLKYAPDDLALHLNLGTALRTKGDSEGAIRHLEAVLRRDTDNPEVHHQLGQTLRQKGDLEGAIREFDTALRLNPEYQDSYYILGQTLRQLASPKRPKARPVAAGAAGLLRAGTDALGRGDVSTAVNRFRDAATADPESGEAQNALGFALGRAGDLNGAIAALRKAVALQPDLAPARFNLGAALWYAGDRAASARELDDAIRLNPAAAEAYSLRGLAHRDAGELPQAGQLCQRALALDPKSQAPYLDLGVILLRMGRGADAIGQFEAALNLPAPASPPPGLDTAIADLRTAISKKGSAEARNTLGRLLGLAGADPKTVLAEFDAAILQRPDFAEAHNNRGLVYTQSGDDEKAAASFREALRHRPDFADAHGNLGAVLATSDIAEGVRELEKATALQPGLLKARYNLALAYGNSPKHGVDKEIAELRKIIALEPQYPRAAFALGKALLRKGVVPEAITTLEQAVRAEPNYGEAHYQLGLALARGGRQKEGSDEIKRGRELIADVQAGQNLVLDMNEGKEALAKGEAEQAASKFAQITRQRPDLSEAHYQLGLALAMKGDPEGATAAWRRTLELNPAHAAAREKLNALPANSVDDAVKVAAFESFIRDGRFQELDPLLRNYIRERPKSAWGWYALGYTLFAQRKIGESISALATSLGLDVRNADAHKVLGRNLMIIGRFDAARTEFEQGSKYAPQSAEMHYNLGKLFSIKDEWPDARKAFERSVALDASYMEAYDGLGFAMEALGDDTAAIANYDKARKLNEQRKGNFATPYVNLSALHNRAGNVDEALQFARKAVEVNPQADRGWFQLAKALDARGELQPAADALNRAIAINGRASTYHYVLAGIYRRMGKPEESRAEMEIFSKLDRETNQLEEKRREALRQEGLAR